MAAKVQKNKVNNFDELVDFLSTKFDNIDQKFDKIDKRFDDVYERFDRIDEKFDVVDARLSTLENGQDYILGEIISMKQEKPVGDYRSRRMEKWIISASKKIGLPYET